MKGALHRLGADDRAAAAIVGAAVGLRLFRRAAVWGGSDAADLPAMVDRLACKPGNVGADLQSLALYKLGAVEPLLLYLQMLVAKYLGIRVHELGWELAPLALGTACVWLAFLVGRRIGGSAVGLFSATLLAVCPLDIIQSRHLGAPWMYEQCCQLGLVYLLLRLASEPSRVARVAFHVLLGVYLWTGNQMPGIFPVLAYGLIAVLAERQAAGARGAFVWRRFGGASLVLPAISLALLLYATFVLRKGHLAHALFEKQHRLGVYLEKWYSDLGYDVGNAVTWLGLAALVLTAASTRKVFSRMRLPSVLFVCYAAPFWFTIPPGSTLTRGYVTYHVGALLLVVALVAGLEKGPRAARYVLPGIVALLLLVAAGQGAFRLYDLPGLGVRGFQGSFTANNGVKTAAAWIRERPRTAGRVFSDAAGGTGLEPPLMTLYFARPHYSMYDAFPPSRPYEKFRANADDIDYLVILPKNRGRAKRYFGDAFAEALRITDGERGEVLLVYARTGTFESPETRDVSVGDRDFDARHGLLCSD